MIKVILTLIKEGGLVVQLLIICITVVAVSELFVHFGVTYLHKDAYQHGDNLQELVAQPPLAQRNTDTTTKAQSTELTASIQLLAEQQGKMQASAWQAGLSSSQQFAFALTVNQAVEVSISQLTEQGDKVSQRWHTWKIAPSIQKTTPHLLGYFAMDDEPGVEHLRLAFRLINGQVDSNNTNNTMPVIVLSRMRANTDNLPAPNTERTSENQVIKLSGELITNDTLYVEQVITPNQTTQFELDISLTHHP